MSKQSKRINPATELVLCIFLGLFGAHRFYAKKTGTGFLYLFTGGLFCIGWAIDIILLISQLIKVKQNKTANAKPASVPISEASIETKEQASQSETQSALSRTLRIPDVKPVANTLPIFNLDFIRECRKCFIAFDVETTGFDPSSDRIIEISAVRFENFKAVASFTTLINPQMHIPSAASRVNHIYDKDVANAPDELLAIPAFCDFIGQDALNGSIPLVAHNAIFDIKFLLHSLSYCGIMADIAFQDTLYMCREAALGLANNKLGTVASHFNIEQEDSHRAEDDARVCGEIFIQLLSIKEMELNSMISELREDELQLCKWLKSIFEEADLNTQFLVFHSGTYLVCRCVYDALKFKPRAKTPYVLIKKDYPVPSSMETAATSKAEGEKYIRVLYHTVADLESLKFYFIERYSETFEMAEKYFSASDRNMRDAARDASNQMSI